MAFSVPEVKEMADKEGGMRRTFIGGWLVGTVNGGGPEITMKNYHGDIYIRKK